MNHFSYGVKFPCRRTSKLGTPHTIIRTLGHLENNYDGIDAAPPYVVIQINRHANKEIKAESQS